jgi:SAM-dependent methyltransferase
MADQLQQHCPKIQTHVGDCQERLDFADGFFDRIIAIHVLEHLPNLPAALREMHRLCNKKTGTFSMVIPCEGSLAYSFARQISAKRLFQKRYKRPYHIFIGREHINLPWEIMAELKPYFEITQRTYFPIPLPFEFCNLFIGATFRPRTSIKQ